MKKLYRLAAFVAAVALLVVACGDDVQITDPDPDPPPALSVSLTPQNIDLDAGDIVNLSVGITGGDPDAQATITCESSDMGVVTTSVSGSSCVVEAVGAGSATVTATVEKGGQEASSSASVTVQEDPEAAAVASVSGDQQVLGFNDESQALVVRVDDQFGAPFAGAEVAFSGDGVAHSLSSASVTTGSNGEASVTVTSGQQEGDITVTASVDGVGAVTFTLEVEDDTPDPEAHSILVVSGAGQTVVVGEESSPLVIRVNDQFGDPFPNAQVEFSGSGVDHTLSSTNETTGGDGRASITVTAGQEEGTIQISASVEGAGTLTFNVEVEDDTPDPEATSIERFSGNNQVLDFGQPSNGLVVQVRDQFGDPFPGAQVAYSGSGVDHTLSSSSATTGTNGRAFVTVTAGQEEGNITITADVDGVGSVDFTITVEEAPRAAEIIRVAGDGQTLDFDEESEALVVRVDDQFGDPFPGATVDFTATGVDRTLSDNSQTTGTNGEASITVTAGQEEGDITITADVDGVGSATFNLQVIDPDFVLAAPGTTSRGITWDGTDLWVVTDGTNGNPADIHRIDPATGSSLQMFPAPSGDHRGLTWDGARLWYSSTSGNIYELNPADGNVESSFASPGSTPRGLAWDGTHLWHNDASDPSTIYRIATDGTVDTDATISSPVDDPLGLTWDGSHLWTAEFDAPRNITRVDPSDGSVAETIENPSTFPLGLAWDTSGPWLWVTDQAEAQIYRIPR